MVRQIEMTFDEIHERCGISSSHWRTLLSKADGDPDYFDYLIEDYKKRMIKKAERLANRAEPIPASQYDGDVLSEDEFRMAIYEYIPIALMSLQKKKYYLKNYKQIDTRDLIQDIFVELCMKVRKRSGKTMYQLYLENVNLWKGYKQVVYRAAENLITDRIKKITRDGDELSLDDSRKSDSEVTIGDSIASKVNEHEQVFINEFMDRCKEKEVKGVSLYTIVDKLLNSDKINGNDVKLKDICKEYGLNIKSVRQAFEEIGAKEILG